MSSRYGVPGKMPRTLPPTATGHPKTVASARRVIKRLMLALRRHDQGGYSSLRGGEWDFISTSLPQTLPAELNALMRFAGIVPDEIKSLGSCDRCAHYKKHHGGYGGPCGPCKRPRMSNFVPIRRKRNA